MRSRFALPVLLALPGLTLALAGLFHPHHLTYDTSTRWWTLHVPGLLVFPLVGVALAALMRGRSDTLAWVVRLAAYTYATFYTALDVINGIAAGYVTHDLGPGVPRSVEIRSLFDIGRPIGDVGEWALIATCLAVLVDQVLQRRWWAVPAVALLPGAWLVRSDHIFSPMGTLGMVLIGLGTGYLAWSAEHSRAQEIH
ncbi:hypothetical protein BH11ACT8_BH11ACT8_08420 [soil metagenome]